MAFLVDSVIEAVIILVLLLAFVLTSMTIGRFESSWMRALLILGFFVLYWGYFALFEALMQGQTPGKKVVGIRVVKDSGRAIRPTEALTRNFMRAVDQLPGFYLFAIISVLVSKEKKRIGDYVAGTVVVHEKAAQEVYMDLQQLDATVPVHDWIMKLNSRDLELIESFLHRRITFEPGARNVAAIRIVQHIRSKSGEGPAPGQPDEDFLQEVAAAIRNSRRG